jgi:uncharacterized protein (DUF488 family)
LFTIGHSNHPIEHFLELLRRHGIEAIADVRSRPYSRFVPHFSNPHLTPSAQGRDPQLELNRLKPATDCSNGGGKSSPTVGSRGTKSMATQPLYTIGYEGSSLEAFTTILRQVGVERLIDIRRVPVSRKRGFSKQPLAHAMVHHGIEYVHIGALGNPKPGREAARSGNFQKFRRIYLWHLATSEAQTALEQAVALALDTVCCLVCLELDHQNCHRTLVANAMVKREAFVLRHLRGADHESIGYARNDVISSHA